MPLFTFHLLIHSLEQTTKAPRTAGQILRRFKYSKEDFLMVSGNASFELASGMGKCWQELSITAKRLSECDTLCSKIAVSSVVSQIADVNAPSTAHICLRRIIWILADWTLQQEGKIGSCVPNSKFRFKEYLLRMVYRPNARCIQCCHSENVL